MPTSENYEVRLELLSTLLHGGNISPVLSRIADREGNSLAVMDTSGKILAHSEPFRQQDPIWAGSIQDGFCPPELVEHIQDVRRSQSVPPGEEAFVRYCESFDLYYLCSRIMVSGQLYGNVFMLQREADFSQESRELLPFIAGSLATSFEGQRERREVRERVRNSLLADILSGAPAEEIHARMRSSGFHFPKNMRVIVLQAQYYLPEAALADQVPGELSAQFAEIRSLYYDQKAVLVTGGGESEEEIRRKLQPVCEKWRLMAGVSDPFPEICLLRESYRNASRALLLAAHVKADGAVHFYHHFRLYDLLDQLPPDTDFSRYIHPALPLLKKTDEEKNTSLYETLEAYTQSGFNQNLAAEKLFLHRNTMNYRRQKIEEITGIDLEDPEERFWLRLSYGLERFAGAARY